MTDLRGFKPPLRRDNFIERNSYAGLKQLEAAIREAYVAKELRTQVLEAEAARLAADARDRMRNDMAKRAAEEAAKIAEEKERAEKIARVSYGLELKAAVKSREDEGIKIREIEIQERKIIEEVSRAIEEEHEASKIRGRLINAERTSAELRIFREIKEIRIQEEAEVVEAQRRRDAEYVAETERRMTELKRARREQELAREAVIDAVSKSLIESRSRRLEVEAIIADLIAEEILFDEEMRLRDEKERRKTAREEAAAEIERHRRVLDERRIRHAIEEEEFACEVMRKVLEDQRVDRLTAEARRRKQIEYRKALEVIIEERRIRRAQELKKLEESFKAERKRAETLRNRIKDMRERLIVRHAGNVAEFIASGALSEEERIVLDRLLDIKR